MRVCVVYVWNYWVLCGFIICLLMCKWVAIDVSLGPVRYAVGGWVLGQCAEGEMGSSKS